MTTTYSLTRRGCFRWRRGCFKGSRRLTRLQRSHSSSRIKLPSRTPPTKNWRSSRDLSSIGRNFNTLLFKTKAERRRFIFAQKHQSTHYLVLAHSLEAKCTPHRLGAARFFSKPAAVIEQPILHFFFQVIRLILSRRGRRLEISWLIILTSRRIM